MGRSSGSALERGMRERGAAVARRLPRAQIKDRSAWFPVLFVGLFVAFVWLRSLADDTGIPTRFRYPIEIERAILGGHNSVVWLQGHLYHGEVITPLTLLVVAVYGSYFVVPPAMALILWWCRARRLARFTVALYATLYFGLVPVFLVPTAPPWLAAQHGYLPPVTRLVPLIAHRIHPGLFATGNQVAGANDVAAMPSLHMAAICVVAWYLPWRRLLGALAAALFAALMGFSLMFLGEHYLVDVVAGLLVAAVAVAATELAARRRTMPAADVAHAPGAGEDAP